MFSGIQIKTKPAGADDPTLNEETAVDALLGCHDRIRYFTELSQKLARAVGQPAPDIASVAEKVHRYFTVALPLHEADENVSLDPRLRRCVPEERLAQASAEMVRQHKDIDEVVDQLVPMWDTLRREPEALNVLAPALRDRSDRLRDLFEGHLALEEQTVFPAIREFMPQQDLDAIRVEMRERRK
jgi:iron-sulfur cluster repair protein YtfE (RIC family)